MSNEYLPTTSQMREVWAESRVNTEYGMAFDAHRAEFDRWLVLQRREERAKAFGDAVDWARSQSGGSADVAADYIELAAAIQEQAKEGTP